MSSSKDEEAEKLTKTGLPFDEGKDGCYVEESPKGHQFMLEVGYFEGLKVFVAEESDDTSDGSGDEEEGVFSFRDGSSFGEIGDDRADAADEHAECEEAETVDEKVMTGIGLLVFHDSFY